MSKHLQQTIFLLWMLGLTGPAQSAVFGVSPTRVTFDASHKSATITVSNNDSEPITIQATVKSWTQVDGKDVYEPTRDVLITPPVVTILPGAEQILRLGFRRPPSPQKEDAYRVYLQEIPPPPKPGFNGVGVALRVGVPVFVMSNKNLAPKPRWGVTYLAGEHALRVVLTNAGTAHLQLYEFTLRALTGDANLVHQTQGSYVLSGQHSEWILKLDPTTHIDSTQLKLMVRTDAGDIEQTIELDKP